MGCKFLKNLAFIILYVSFFGLSVKANDTKDPREQYLFELYPWLTQDKVNNWKQETITLFRSENVTTAKLSSLNLSQWLLLWNMSDLKMQEPDFTKLKENIDYWKNNFGIKNLNQFVLNTDHSHYYHLFTGELKSWKSMFNFMVEVGIFSLDPFSTKSINYFLINQLWAEGYTTSRKSTPDLWNKWLRIFTSNSDIKNKIEDIFSEEYLINPKNRDLLQRIYLSLSSDMLEVVTRYQHLIGSDFLIYLIAPKNDIMLSAFVYDVQDILERLDELLKERKSSSSYSLEKIKLVALEVTLSVIKSAKSVYINDEVDRILNKKVQEVINIKMCKGFLN